MENTIKLNPFSSRKLKNNEWIIVSKQNELLVIDDETYSIIKNGVFSVNYFESSFIQLLVELGFISDNPHNDLTGIEPEPKAFKFLVSRIILLFLAVVSIILVTYFVFAKGLPFESAVQTILKNPLLGLLLVILFSCLSTFLHELMHVFFSNTTLQKKEIIQLDVKKAVASVSMSHVWTWSMLGRICAISSGMILDLSILMIFFIIDFFVTFSWIPILLSVFITRILWQFRINKKTDIQLLLSFIFDDPFLLTGEGLFITKKMLINVGGIFITIVLIICWVIPLIQNNV